ncbi:MAG: DUF1028 domain-containing protein [Planctomycetota bacterium]|nr:MAG: DUF1028 domain-containing protein [Planctomycetota bacterium]
MLRRLGTLLLALVLLAAPALATWSIVVVDLATGEVAVATATCLTNFDLRTDVTVIVPGFGAGAHQSSVDTTGQNRLTNWLLLQQGVPVDEILQTIKDNDPLKRWRQIGIVSLRGDAVSFTGKGCFDWAGGVTGQVGSLVYAIQGNVLTGQPVIDAAEQALRTSTGPLPERLLAAMDAAAGYGGDGRCSCSVAYPTSCGSPPPNFTKSAHIATLLVARPGDPIEPCTPTGCAEGDLYLVLNVAYAQAGDPDPMITLRQDYDAWKLLQPGRPDAYESQKWISQPVVAAGGAPPVQLVIDLRDLDGNPVTHGGHAISLEHDPTSAGGAALLAVHDHQDGTYTLDVQPGAEPGVDLLRVRVDDGIQPVTLWPPVELVVAPPPPAPANDPAPPAGLPFSPRDLQAQLLPDGLTAWFLAEGPGGARQLWRARRPAPGAPFGRPERIPTPGLAGWWVTDFSVDAAELELFLAARAPGDPVQRIWRAQRPDTLSDFGPPEPLPELDSGLGEGGPCLSPDGLVLAFHSERAGTSDLWLARRPVAGGRFAPPVRLDALDDGSDERFPFWDRNGTRLLFSRDPVSGPTRIWRSDRGPGGWLPPEPLPGGLPAGDGPLAATARDEAAAELWLSRAAAGGVRELLAAPLAAGSLTASSDTLSAAAGGRIDFQLDAGPAWAGASYLLLAGAAAGPAQPLPGGGVLPFPTDDATDLVRALAGQPPFLGFTGVLDAVGAAAAALDLAPGQVVDPGLIGRGYRLAFVAERGGERFVSAAVDLSIEP